MATQLHAPAELWSTYELTSRQGQRHQLMIREYLGFRPVTVNDVKVLAQWLHEEVLPFDPQARHGLDRAIDWCRAQGLEPPAMDHLKRILRSAVRGFEAAHHERIYARLSEASQTEIDRLLATEEPDHGCDGFQ